MLKEEWLQRYLYIEEQNVFFYYFPCELYECLAKFLYGQPTQKLDNPIVWTPELVKRLEGSKNKVLKAIYYWNDSILGGFITDFTIDTSINYSKDERMFFKGTRDKYLKSLKTCIKILLCEKQVMPLN